GYSSDSSEPYAGVIGEMMTGASVTLRFTDYLSTVVSSYGNAGMICAVLNCLQSKGTAGKTDLKMTAEAFNLFSIFSFYTTGKAAYPPPITFLFFCWRTVKDFIPF
nr:hypothetical protein [Lachnospiraceae bacterium]